MMEYFVSSREPESVAPAQPDPMMIMDCLDVAITVTEQWVQKLGDALDSGLDRSTDLTTARGHLLLYPRGLCSQSRSRNRYGSEL